MLVLNLRKYRYILGLAVILPVLALSFKWINGGNDVPKALPPGSKQQKSRYGEYLAWEEVNRLFPRYAYAAVMDLEKKKKFAVQRRGGTYHADVQPLTARDTIIMKDIYDGKWSWKRRAVIIELEDGRKIAASMNGMPHGGGAIRGNKFNGHFCIHFRDSKTHIGNKVDTAHQLMVWKAAGILENKLEALGARESLEVFFAALDQGERGLVSRMLAGEGKLELVEALDGIDNIKLVKVTETGSGQYKAEVRFSFDNSPAQYMKCLSIKMTKHNAEWKVPATSIKVLVSGERAAPSREVIGWEEEDEC